MSGTTGTTSTGWSIEEIRPESHAFYGDGIYAMARHAELGTLHLSRLEGESAWVIDGYFGANSFPHWCHGFGSRCTRLQTPADDELVAALDAAAAELVAVAS
jgi:hypothetical protein